MPHVEPQKLTGTIEFYNLAPSGLPNSLSLKTATGSVQVVFPARLSETIVKVAKEGTAVEITATGRPGSTPNGGPAAQSSSQHVLQLLAVTGADGKQMEVSKIESPKPTHVDGNIKHLNFDPNGRLNGVVLATGDLILFGSEVGNVFKLEAGQKLVADGQAKAMPGGHQIIQAATINGMAVAQLTALQRSDAHPRGPRLGGPDAVSPHSGIQHGPPGMMPNVGARRVQPDERPNSGMPPHGDMRGGSGMPPHSGPNGQHSQLRGPDGMPPHGDMRDGPQMRPHGGPSDQPLQMRGRGGMSSHGDMRGGQGMPPHGGPNGQPPHMRGPDGMPPHGDMRGGPQMRSHGELGGQRPQMRGPGGMPSRGGMRRALGMQREDQFRSGPRMGPPAGDRAWDDGRSVGRGGMQPHGGFGGGPRMQPHGGSPFSDHSNAGWWNRQRAMGPQQDRPESSGHTREPNEFRGGPFDHGRQQLGMNPQNRGPSSFPEHNGFQQQNHPRQPRTSGPGANQQLDMPAGMPPGQRGNRPRQPWDPNDAGPQEPNGPDQTSRESMPPQRP